MVQMPIGKIRAVPCRKLDENKAAFIALHHTCLSLTVLEACDSNFSRSVTICMHVDGQQDK